MLFALLVPVALAGCPEPETMRDAAEGGWLRDDQRRCLQRALKRRRTMEEASRLLLADADARSEDWLWTTLAHDHVERVPADGDVWLELVMETHRHGSPREVVLLTNRALDVRGDWAAGDDPRVVTMMRLRTYAALHDRGQVGLGEDVVRYAREWLETAQDTAPAVAWELAGMPQPDAD